MLNINKQKIGILLIITIFFMLFTISATSASISGPGNVKITDESGNDYGQLSSNTKVYSIEKDKIPKKWKNYENYTFQVAKNKVIKYKASINPNGNPLITNMSGVKVKNAYIDFGDGTKKRTTKWISHAYKKSGWYKITIKFNATFEKCMFLGMESSGTGEIINGTKEYLVYVTNKPQLTISNITSGYTSYANYKKKNINYLDIKVTNIGSTKSKATKIKMWYQKPGDENFGKIYPKLKKYTKSAKLKALSAEKSAIVRIYFNIPKKYQKLWKNIKLDSLNRVNQIDRDATLYKIR